jgi:hypothetical protein
MLSAGRHRHLERRRRDRPHQLSSFGAGDGGDATAAVPPTIDADGAARSVQAAELTVVGVADRTLPWGTPVIAAGGDS